MKLLEERIRKDGTVKAGNVLKVDSFLNHQMDIDLFNEMGKEWRLPVSVSPVWQPSIFMCLWYLQKSPSP